MKMYGLLLAGGKSSRMGQDKAELQICGVSLLQQGEEVLSHSLCQQVLISRNCGAGIKDRFSGLGPLAGIDAAIQQIDDGAWLTVMPVDMPLISAEHLIELQQQAMVTEQACYFANFMLPCVVQVTLHLLWRSTIDVRRMSHFLFARIESSMVMFPFHKHQDSIFDQGIDTFCTCASGEVGCLLHSDKAFQDGFKE